MKSIREAVFKISRCRQADRWTDGRTYGPAIPLYVPSFEGRIKLSNIIMHSIDLMALKKLEN